MSKTILEQAVEDVKQVRKAAEESAKNLLVEAMSPKIKEMISAALGEDSAAKIMEIEAAMDADQANGVEKMPQDDEGLGMYEADADGDEDSNDSDDFEITVDDDGDGDEDEKIVKKEAAEMTENDDVTAEGKGCDGDEEMEESVEITAEDLKKAFSEVLSKGLKEADVSKGFGDVANPDKGETGLLDKSNGEKYWNEEDPPASEDWTVKETKYRKQIRHLQGQLAQHAEAVSYLKKNLNEMNLFNSKLVYTTRLLQGSLSNKQKLAVVEAIDSAKTKREVELVYKTLSESLKIAGVLAEASKPGMLKGPKASRFSKPSSTLNESAQREGSVVTDWQRLAGLID
jgi:hypothetical protein